MQGVCVRVRVCHPPFYRSYFLEGELGSLKLLILFLTLFLFYFIFYSVSLRFNTTFKRNPNNQAPPTPPPKKKQQQNIQKKIHRTHTFEILYSV